MSPEKAINVRIGSRSYLLSSDDDYLESMKDGFEPHTVRLLESLLSENSLVIDAGANIGCTSLLFASIASRVISFEPSPTTFKFLTRNVDRSGFSNIELHNCALGATPGVSRLSFAANNRSGGFISDKVKASAGHVEEVIRITTLDAVVRELKIPHVDFIKIDVEGFEKSVLEGAQQVLQRDRPAVVLELNHWCLNAFQRICVPDFLDYLGRIFPRLLAVEGNRYLDLHNESERYMVMYRHILQFQYTNVVCAFDADRLARFSERFSHGI
jgi:FkbM family methyltransferase